MTLPANLPALLRAAGLTVVVQDGWRTRGRPGRFGPVGVLEHHTGSKADGRATAVNLFTKDRGRPGQSGYLPAPLCQLSTDRAGTVYIGAAGRANHAGKARATGPMPAGDGNALYIGIEHQLSGYEPWTPEQYRTAVVMTGVLLRHLGKPASHTRAHYETSVTGKWDPGDPNGIGFKGARVLDMDRFRDDVATWMRNGTAPGDTSTPSPEEDDMKDDERSWLAATATAAKETNARVLTLQAAAVEEKKRDAATLAAVKALAGPDAGPKLDAILDQLQNVGAAIQASTELAEVALEHVTDADARAELERLRQRVLDALAATP